MPPISLLQLEGADSKHEPVTSKQLASILHHRPVPVVLLAGCLTAAQPGAIPDPDIPKWMRGNQGMAQALINSESGVQFAVGMRCQVDAGDAEAFLERFFTSLLTTNRGNVEMAVARARTLLFQTKPDSSCWAAPVAFTSLKPEPLFEYMTKPPKFQMTETMKQAIGIRTTFLWPVLEERKGGMRSAALDKAVKENRASLAAEVLKHGAFLMPELVDDARPGTKVAVPLTLEGPLTLRRLEGKFVVGGGLQIEKIEAGPELAGGNFNVWTNAADPASFQIQTKNGNAAALPQGAIVTLQLSIPAETLGCCLVNLEVAFTDSGQAYWAGHNAVIVVPA
jgi:hypothetical protein